MGLCVWTQGAEAAFPAINALPLMLTAIEIVLRTNLALESEIIPLVCVTQKQRFVNHAVIN
jgi:hypothetical protein